MTNQAETATITDSQLSNYELVIIMRPDAGEDALNARLDNLTRIITTGGGAVTAVNRWGKKKLAYPIKRVLEGNYVFAQVKIKPATSKELEANLRISEDIIRYLLVKV